MKITVLNGSPKGNNSITLQYIRFLQKRWPQHTFQLFNIAHDIRKIEADEALFVGVIDGIKEADGVLWAFPLYYFLVSAQYKRFIELIWERKVEDIFKNKYTAAISTSIHFFDHTAHNYIHAICDDLGMRYLGSYSADMYDLTKESEQTRLLLFSQIFLGGIEKGITTAREYHPAQTSLFRYEPQGNPQPVVDQGNKEILILTDCAPGDTNLLGMIEKLKRFFIQGAKVVNLSDIDIKGGCLGCIR
jgi:NAD(P)H-dependent FMN reductase